MFCNFYSKTNPAKTGRREESCKNFAKGVARFLGEAIMRALPRCRASKEAADIGIYNKREDSLCGCFVAVKLLDLASC